MATTILWNIFVRPTSPPKPSSLSSKTIPVPYSSCSCILDKRLSIHYILRPSAASFRLRTSQYVRWQSELAWKTSSGRGQDGFYCHVKPTSLLKLTIMGPMVAAKSPHRVAVVGSVVEGELEIRFFWIANYREMS